MNNIETTKSTDDKEVRIITSKNSPKLAKKIKEASSYFLKVNDQLYKDLANK